MGADDQKHDRFERYVQMFFGIVLWGYMLWSDMSSGVDFSELTTQELIIMGVRYGFAGILIYGVTIAQIVDLIRAWRGK